MIVGGCTTLTLIITDISLPLGLDANIFGIGAALIAYGIVTFMPESLSIK